MKKKLPTAVIANELTQSSVFFQRSHSNQSHKQSGKQLHPQREDQTKDHRGRQQHTPPPPPIVSSTSAPPSEQEKVGLIGEDAHEAIKHDGMTDVMTSLPQDVNLKEWQEVIENTETQNSALRLTREERYAVEDVINELRRKYGIKTSMNEVARLGLLLLIADFKKNKKESLIHKVKKA